MNHLREVQLNRDVSARAVTEALDTSLLVEDLRRRYMKGHAPVEANFREMVKWVRQGDQFTHQIHPYPAKLLPHIANFFARASCLRKDSAFVLDPFSGSGTVALESSLAGAIPVIADSNPLALLIAKVKTTPYNTDDLLLTAQRLRKRVGRLRTAPVVSVVNEHLWYLPKTKRSLEIILRGILEIEDTEVQDFFRVCFSVAARRLSRADPSISVPVRIKRKASLTDATNKAIGAHLSWLEQASAVDEFSRVVQANLARVAAANATLPFRSRCVVAGTDARRLQSLEGHRLPEGSIHLTITSPPYGSAQKYVRASSLSLNWLSLCPPNALAELESRSIGREHLSLRREPKSLERMTDLPAPIAEVLNQIRLRDAHRAAITETYLREMRQAFTEIERATALGGHVVVVIGNNTVTGLVVENDTFVIEVMRHLGLELEFVLSDRIHSRGLMTARNSSAALIAGETILMFRK